MPPRELLIRNACVITGTGLVFPSGFLFARDGWIEAVGDASKEPPPGEAQVIDARGRYVLPGFINPHMHFYGWFARGMRVPRMRAFGEVLRELWWRLDAKLTLEEVHASALLGGIECLRAGVTSVFDHHASYGAIHGSLGAISRAMEELGLHASLCFEISDRAGVASRDEALEETASWLEAARDRHRRDPAFLQRGMVGLHASMTLSDDALRAARGLMEAYRVGAHIHVAEGIEDVEQTRHKHALSPVARLVKAGILCEGSIAAHCVHVDAKDIDLLAKSRATVVHNPMSNLGNAVGIAPLLAMAERGIPIAVGTDGMSAGIATDVRLASVLQRPAAHDAQAGWQEIQNALWLAAPQLASAGCGCEIGTLKRGAAADAVIIDAVPPTPVTSDNAFGHVLFGALAARMRTTIVAGHARMLDFVIPDVDEEEIASEAREMAKALWKRIQ
jgi:putative selenium metabolism protein SsnA